MNVEFILWLVFALGTIFVCVKTSEIGKRDFDMKLIFSFSFVLMVVTAVLVVFAVLASNSDPGSAMTAFVGGIITGGSAGYLNVQKSNPKFGVWFTFVQFIAVIAIVVPLLFVVSKMTTRGLTFR